MEFSYSPTSRRKNKPVGLGISILGVVFVLSASYSEIDTIYFLQNSNSAVARISNFVTEPGEDNKTTYYPQFEFKTESGESVICTSRNGSYSKDFQIGQEIRIKYARTKPIDARIDDWSSLYGIGLVFLFIGFILASVGFSVLRNSKGEDLPSLGLK